MDVVVNQFDVFLAKLDPVKGSEIAKTRPVLIISPDEMNDVIKTVIIAPMTSNLKKYPMRYEFYFDDRMASLALDHLRSVDKKRLIKKIGEVDYPHSKNILDLINQMFKYEN
jgi:mRNA interferase MazF